MYDLRNITKRAPRSTTHKYEDCQKSKQGSEPENRFNLVVVALTSCKVILCRCRRPSGWSAAF